MKPLITLFFFLLCNLPTVKLPGWSHAYVDDDWVKYGEGVVGVA